MQVVAHLSEPVVYAETGMHLDGILAAAAFADLDERTRRRMPPLTSDWPPDIKLPLAKWIVPGDGCDAHPNLSSISRSMGGRRQERGLWGWCASAAQFEPLARGVVEVRKRPDVDAMIAYTDAKSVNISSGDLKAYDLSFPTVFAHQITWYALGDVKEVARLLRTYVLNIGKKRHHGNGAVMQWEVSEVEEDRSILWDGRLVRRLPLESGADGRPGMGAIRPPYHHPSRLAESVEPENVLEEATC